MPRYRRVTKSQLIFGVLVDGPEVRLELVAEAGPGTIKLSADRRPDGQTYFNFRPKGQLARILAIHLDGYKPGEPVGLHRAVVAASGRDQKRDEHVHHLDHNHLDNRAANLAPVPKEAHQAYHDEHPRLPDDPQMELFEGAQLFVKVTYKSGTDTTLVSDQDPAARDPLQGEAVPGRGRGRGPTPSGLVNVDSFGDTGQSGVETPFEEAGKLEDDFGLPLHQRRILYSKELQRFGLRSVAARRARLTLKVVRQLGEAASATRIVEAVTAKNGSERSVYNTLKWLKENGFVSVTKSDTYQLMPGAYKTQRTRQS